MSSGIPRGSPEVPQCVYEYEGQWLWYNDESEFCCKRFESIPPTLTPFLSLVGADLILKFNNRFPLGSVPLLPLRTT